MRTIIQTAHIDHVQLELFDSNDISIGTLQFRDTLDLPQLIQPLMDCGDWQVFPIANCPAVNRLNAMSPYERARVTAGHDRYQLSADDDCLLCARQLDKAQP